MMVAVVGGLSLPKFAVEVCPSAETKIFVIC